MCCQWSRRWTSWWQKPELPLVRPTPNTVHKGRSNYLHNDTVSRNNVLSYLTRPSLYIFNQRFLRHLFLQIVVLRVTTLLLNLAGAVRLVDAPSAGYTKCVLISTFQQLLVLWTLSLIGPHGKQSASGLCATWSWWWWGSRWLFWVTNKVTVIHTTAARLHSVPKIPPLEKTGSKNGMTQATKNAERGAW